MFLIFKIMKNIFKEFVAFISILVIISFFSFCKSDDNNQPEEPQKNEIKLPVSGKYKWSFTITTEISQISTHEFSNEKIRYTMVGGAYNNAYDMILESYDQNESRIISVGQGGSEGYNKDGVYFVMFLKDITENSVSIYKKECISKEHAYSFPLPIDSDPNDHGWNKYEKEE